MLVLRGPVGRRVSELGELRRSVMREGPSDSRQRQWTAGADAGSVAASNAPTIDIMEAT